MVILHDGTVDEPGVTAWNPELTPLAIGVHGLAKVD
jgi:hypothetical protein